MPIDPEKQHHVLAAQGYCELGMFEDAREELDQIPPESGHAKEVLAVRMDIHHGLKEWEQMQALARKLTEEIPGSPHGWVSWAYATRRAESIEAARPILLDALERFPGQTNILYNLACYECQLGKLETARNLLKKCLELEPRMKELASEDEDLQPLWSGNPAGDEGLDHGID